MKYAIFCLAFIATCFSAISKTPAPKSIYDFKIESLDGGTIDFSAFKGKKILVVNTASKCGFTKQYKGLEALYESHKDKLVIVGFPSDNFGGQEYQDNNAIKDFCEKNFGVTFPLTTRVDVKGDKATPIFQYLCSKTQNGVLDATIGWNFNKFIIDEKGRLLAHFDSKVTPDSPELLKYIDGQ
ncbi:glutathione peroxidase [Filimonas zeae]|uniref:Glutathione peroxidase n=1 Tax=Filimonas zeae TaxID=1737353 RepID=A0A917MZ32_9BACT|nr:glutathione peroxidase [Filimonas zeae]MDR6342247.1 glutathione peroxidase [Filimonas zeae]GGH80578.1 glutathione peroxidase [Filimonas zeae]